MKAGHVNDVPVEPVEMKGAEGVYIQWLIKKEDGAKNYAMRRFILKPGARIPRHMHGWEHEIFVLSGKGKVGAGEEEVEVGPGSFLYIEPDIPHWYENTGDEDWVFLCIIPYL